ncbi:hypothetical protein [Pseudomonas fluorescens]|uniref:Lactococcus phage M3 protein n=1 Tax=Pseudomonas fluorescens TaxID=294 RepID=A0A0F4VGW9_PSEFL|nr:hypothetical protein [Pseudomonas fluorescens]KJZ67272.1 lactococcus phage M3 protein [Pseudomonas fluorescens]
MTKRIVVGIDPGQTGGIAIINESFELIDCFVMPILKVDGKSKVDAGALYNKLSGYHIDLAILEKVGARPGQGVVSMFSFGESYGCARAVLECLGVQCRLERPQAWRGGQSLTGLSKEQIAEVAHNVFGAAQIYGRKNKYGNRSIRDGISDALMIAKYGVRFLD